MKTNTVVNGEKDKHRKHKNRYDTGIMVYMIIMKEWSYNRAV